jgi:hypothetical protein
MPIDLRRLFLSVFVLYSEDAIFAFDILNPNRLAHVRLASV